MYIYIYIYILVTRGRPVAVVRAELPALLPDRPVRAPGDKARGDDVVRASAACDALRSVAL